MSEGADNPGAVGLPAGVTVGHWTDPQGQTGCTVVLGPPSSVSSGEVRGGGPGTREFELLSPATSTPGAHAILLAGGSAFGLAAADGVVSWLEERGIGFPTPAGPVPLVTGAVVFDLALGGAGSRPGAGAGRAACEASSTEVERGNVGAGTGCTAGKLDGPDGWTKTGLGAAGTSVDGALLTGIAVVNPFGDVLAADGSVLAGLWRDGGWLPTVEAIRGPDRPQPLGESTTLVCLLTDAALTKTEAWKISRAASAGVARALSPAATAVDGDLVVCLATGEKPVDAFKLSVLAAEVAAAAIRDGARSAADSPGAPSRHSPARGGSPARG